MPAKPPLTTLEQYRRVHDLSYVKLGRLIEATTGCARDPATWRRVCEGVTDPRSTTADAVSRFLEIKTQESAAS